jgi:cell division protein FtsW
VGKGVNSKGISYQNDQALLAIGNGGFSGRGYGQSIQKFHYLPEPAGDSVFAVFAEEFGFIGSVIVVGLFFYLVISLVLISVKENNIFVKNVIIGGATLIFLQTLLNIGSMLKIIPLSGDTLPFFSQGGTALICNFLLIGIMLQLTKKNL